MEDHCTECGFDARTDTMADLASRLHTCPLEVAALIARFGPDEVRQRTVAGTWAAIEYLGHLRDLMAYHRYLIEQAVDGDGPAIDSPDPDQAVADALYIEADPHDLQAQFERRVHRLVALVESLDADSAARQLTIGGRRVDVRFVACSALHEAHHHCQDLAHLVH